MTYRERRMRKADRLREWADKRTSSAAQTLKAGEKYHGDHAFNFQPGHIPERARVIAREDRAFESLNKASSMNGRADEIERQADRAIYSDDPDAIQALRERITSLEAQRDRMKAINAAIRKGEGWGQRINPPLTKDESAELVRLARFSVSDKPGFPPYAFQNLSGNINRQRKRLAQLEAAAGRTA